MASRLPRKDDYDPAPYATLGDEHHNGGDVRQRVADLIVDTRTRPGFMASRLNLAGIPAPNGGEWCWITVRDLKDRERARRSQANWDDFMNRTGKATANPSPVPTLPNPDPRDDDNWRPENESPGDGERLRELPDTAAGRRGLWKHIYG